jgi:hypothetical protein
MPSKQTHKVVEPTKANFEKDCRNKVKLNKEFEEFNEVFAESALTSSDVKKLEVPLKKLKAVMHEVAHGFVFVKCDEKKTRS